MHEYKIVRSKFTFTKNAESFEDEINKYARDGWRVVNFTNESMQFYALLERSKNR